jgi:hypothetical protein
MKRTNKSRSESILTPKPKTTPLSSSKSFSVLQQQTSDTQEEIKTELNQMMTNLNKSVYELSLEHKIICIFIKWFGCPM